MDKRTINDLQNTTQNTKDQMTKDKRTNNDLQNTTQSTKDRTTRTQLKTGDELRCSGRVGSFYSISDTHRVDEKYLKILRRIKEGYSLRF